jgi:Tfp pilus assembly protein PilP
MTRMKRELLSITLASVLPMVLPMVLGVVACSEDVPTTQQRGMGGKGIKVNSKPADSKAAGSKAAGSRRSSSTSKGGEPQEAPAEPEFERPKRVDLTRDDFSGRARDPFHNYMAAEALAPPDPVEIVRKEREVKLSEYTFDELRLIAIVNAGRSVAPRALFLSSDNKSKSVKQGEYFSSAEVLLASVNRDYIEIEVVDPELTPGWNLERGERRVIYLKDE